MRRPELFVGLDPIAWLRQGWRADEPDPAAAAVLAELGGADGVSLGLRTDRRHGQERDARLLRSLVKTRLLLRIAPTPESVKLVAPIRPDVVVLTPERPETLLHETGFDLRPGGAVAEAASMLKEAGLDVLASIDPDVQQVKAAHRMGLAGLNIIGARLGSARLGDTRGRELEEIARCAELCDRLGMRAHVAHGLRLGDLRDLSSVKGLASVELGHAACARAALVGLPQAVADARFELESGRPSPPLTPGGPLGILSRRAGG